MRCPFYSAPVGQTVKEGQGENAKSMTRQAVWRGGFFATWDAKGVTTPQGLARLLLHRMDRDCFGLSVSLLASQ